MDPDLFKSLKQRILFQTGLTVITSRDCKWIATEIRYTLNRHISVTTIKRVFGFAKTKHHFSKYTIAALNEYVSIVKPGERLGVDASKHFLISRQASYLSVSKSPAIIDVLSFIVNDRSCIFELNEGEPHLHPEQLAVTAIKMMLKDNLSSLAICENGKCIGRIYTDELKCFINCRDVADPLIFHRLNFNLETAITIMKRER